MMMKRFIIILTCLLVMPFVSTARAGTMGSNKLTIDLAQSHIDITTGFVGGHLELFGVRKGYGDIAVILRGPARAMKVRRKSSVIGAWINRDAVTFSAVPSYYDYALSGDLDDLASAEILKEHQITPENLQLETASTGEARDKFFTALIRNKREERLFAVEAAEVKFLDDQFFKVVFLMPDNVPVGDYVVDVLYFEKGVVIDTARKKFKVEQVGTSARIYDFSHDRSFIYGVLCVCFALLIGWVSNRLRRN